MPEAWKRYPFREEPPRIGNDREYVSPPPPSSPRAGMPHNIFFLLLFFSYGVIGKSLFS